MSQEELVAYVKRQLANGHEPQVIREHLLNHGHSVAATDAALNAAGKVSSKTTHFNPFSGKAVAFALLALVALGFLGYGGYALFFGSGDLAGAATEPVLPHEELVVDEAEQANDRPQRDSTQETDDAPTGAIDEDDASADTDVSEEVADTEESDAENAEETEEESVETASIPDDEEEADTSEETQEEEEEVQMSSCTTQSACAAGETCFENTCQADADKDLLPDTLEASLGTYVYEQDSDGDALSDYDEYAEGTDPMDENDPGLIYCTSDYDCAGYEVCGTQGICIACSDSDDDNYAKKGVTTGAYYTTGEFLVSQDSCSSSGQLIEYHCRSDNYLYYESVDCEEAYGSGYSCNMGVCEK